MYCQENLREIIPNLSVWYASVANRVSLVEIMLRILKYPMPDQTSLLCRRRKVQFGIYRTQIRSRDHDIAGYDDSGNGFWLAYGPFHLWSAAGNHGSCIDWLDEYKYHMHDSLQGHLIQEIGHWSWLDTVMVNSAILNTSIIVCLTVNFKSRITWRLTAVRVAGHLWLYTPKILETCFFWCSLNVPLLLGEKSSFARLSHRCRWYFGTFSLPSSLSTWTTSKTDRQMCLLWS